MTYLALRDDELLTLAQDLPRLGELATHARQARYGATVHVFDDRRTINKDQESLKSLVDGAAVFVVPDRAEARVAYLQELRFLGQHPGEVSDVICTSPDTNASHRLWLVACAALLLPKQIRVLARHDVIGIRLAQLALDFGADCLCGPTTQARALPIAGVHRPNETSLEALRELVAQVGLSPSLTNSN